MKADAFVTVDTSEAEKKLENIIKLVEQIYALVDKSWLLRLIFYGFKKLENQ